VHEPESRFSPRDLNFAMPGQAVGLAAAMLGVQGPTYTFNNSCASGLVAIGNAFRELQAGRIDVAFGTGHDAALIAPIYQMYRDAGLLSRERERPERAIQPYAGSSANAFGEGAVTLVLETRAHAEARRATPLAQVLAFRHGNGGEHPTDVDFTGTRPAELIGSSLAEAQLEPEDIDFVLGHGNGVQASDISELNYMKKVFGRRTRDVPLISTKPIYGHTLGASSALNAAAAALMLHHDYVVPTVALDEQRVVHGFNHQANQGQARTLRSGLVVAYGIGGQNATLLLRKVEA
jgi:3-oxoacyl-[acyl-carrier-protein] synthase II